MKRPSWNSWQYPLATTRGVRSVMEAVNEFRLERYRRKELRKCSDYPNLLMNYEAREYSQNGEDGVIEEILGRVGTTNKVFVEFGCGDGRQNNTRRLAELPDWSGFWIDADEAGIRVARTLGLSVTIEQSRLTRENIVPTFRQLGVPYEFDVLSIDVDGNDYWLWNELANYTPAWWWPSTMPHTVQDSMDHALRSGPRL